MNQIDIFRTDLNLLVALDVLLEERSVTRAARRLHLSQSAASHALGRLRELLGDPVLVRVGGEMRPTARAARIAPELARHLRSLQRVLGEEEGEFDPASTARTFTLVAPDFAAAALPTLVRTMSVEAPRAGLELVAPSRGLHRDVAEGRYDLALAPPPGDSAEGLNVGPAVKLPWAVFARRGHPAIRGWGARAWAAYPHVRVRTPSDAPSPVDRAAAERGIVRRPGPLLPHFLLAPPILAASDCLMTVPHAILAQVAPRYGLVALECPLPLPPIPLALAWSALAERDPANVWFRALVAAAVEATFSREGAAGGGPGKLPASRRRKSETAIKYG